MRASCKDIINKRARLTQKTATPDASSPAAVAPVSAVALVERPAAGEGSAENALALRRLAAGAGDARGGSVGSTPPTTAVVSGSQAARPGRGSEAIADTAATAVSATAAGQPDEAAHGHTAAVAAPPPGCEGGDWQAQPFACCIKSSSTIAHCVAPAAADAGRKISATAARVAKGAEAAAAAAAEAEALSRPTSDQISSCRKDGRLVKKQGESEQEKYHPCRRPNKAVSREGGRKRAMNGWWINRWSEGQLHYLKIHRVGLAG
jgi:hypothetical protein